MLDVEYKAINMLDVEHKNLRSVMTFSVRGVSRGKKVILNKTILAKYMFLTSYNVLQAIF